MEFRTQIAIRAVARQHSSPGPRFASKNFTKNLNNFKNFNLKLQPISAEWTILPQPFGLVHFLYVGCLVGFYIHYVM